jgi:hypothetical protein
LRTTSKEAVVSIPKVILRHESQLLTQQLAQNYIVEIQNRTIFTFDFRKRPEHLWSDWGTHPSYFITDGFQNFSAVIEINVSPIDDLALESDGPIDRLFVVPGLEPNPAEPCSENMSPWAGIVRPASRNAPLRQIHRILEIDDTDRLGLALPLLRWTLSSEPLPSPPLLSSLRLTVTPRTTTGQSLLPGYRSVVNKHALQLSVEAKTNSSGVFGMYKLIIKLEDDIF